MPPLGHPATFGRLRWPPFRNGRCCLVDAPSATPWIGSWTSSAPGERGAGPARRGGGRQDGAAGAPSGRCVRVLHRQGHGRAVRDGAPVRRAASALRADARPARSPAGSAARRARHRVLAARRSGAQSTRGRPRGAQPPVGGGRGSAGAVHRRRRAVARSSVRTGARRSWRAGCSRSPWPWCSPRASRSTSSRGCPSWRSKVFVTLTPLRCSSPRSPGRATSSCASGSLPRREAIRWRSWSCRAG